MPGVEDILLLYILDYVVYKVTEIPHIAAVGRKWRQGVQNPTFWAGKEVDLTGMHLPIPLLLILRDVFSSARRIVVDAELEAPAAVLRRPLFVNWQPQSPFRIGNLSILSTSTIAFTSWSAVPSTVEAHLTFGQLPELMLLGLTSCQNSSELLSAYNSPVVSAYPNFVALCITFDPAVLRARWCLDGYQRGTSWCVDGRPFAFYSRDRYYLSFSIARTAEGTHFYLGGESIDMVPVVSVANDRLALIFEAAGDALGDNTAVDLVGQTTYAGPGGLANNTCSCTVCGNNDIAQVEACGCGLFYCEDHGGLCDTCEFVGCVFCLGGHDHDDPGF